MLRADTSLVNPPVTIGNVRGIWFKVSGRSRKERPGDIGGYYRVGAEALVPTHNIGS